MQRVFCLFYTNKRNEKGRIPEAEILPIKECFLENAEHLEYVGRKENAERGEECAPDDELSRQGYVGIHLLRHRYAGDRDGCAEDSDEGGKVCTAEATEKVRYAESEHGHDKVSRQDTEGYVFLKLRDGGELKLCAEDDESEGRRNRG